MESSPRTDILVHYFMNIIQFKLYTSYQLDAQIALFIQCYTSLSFEQYYAHPQEVKLCVYSIWYRHCL